MKFGHDVQDQKPQICICSGECETVLPPACARAHPACSISAHLARSIRINCISARERARWIEREGERFSPSVGLVLLQGESFKILPPMWLLVFTLMTPLLSLCFLPHDFPEFGAARLIFLQQHGAETPLIYKCIGINYTGLLNGMKAISDEYCMCLLSHPLFLFLACLLPPTSISTINHQWSDPATNLCLLANYYMSHFLSLRKWLLHLLSSWGIFELDNAVKKISLIFEKRKIFSFLYLYSVKTHKWS